MATYRQHVASRDNLRPRTPPPTPEQRQRAEANRQQHALTPPQSTSTSPLLANSPSVNVVKGE